MLISVGWLPPYWCPSRRLLRSRLEGRGLVTRSKIAPKTGAASPPMARVRDQRWFAPSPGWAAGLRRPRDRAGDGGVRLGNRPNDPDGGVTQRPSRATERSSVEHDREQSAATGPPSPR